MTEDGIDDVIFGIQTSGKDFIPMMEIRKTNGNVLMTFMTIDQMKQMQKEIAAIDSMGW